MFASFLSLIVSAGFTVSAQLNNPAAPPQARTVNGLLEGTHHSGIHIFKGIPFAAPPTGQLRWKEPQPAPNWTGIRMATQFGPRAMQLPIYSDMNFRSASVSEDCLYLNVWTPASSSSEKLPVLVYFYGGGFRAGDGSEFRYDGESIARTGVVAITVNYRLAVFGFFAHPALTKESPHHASGNYGLLDQAAALVWVQQNIAAFGGDPKRITIAGESAGSFSVSAQMASPLSKNIISGAIGESGSLLGLNTPAPLTEVEKSGLEFAQKLGAGSLDALRALPADEVLKAAESQGAPRFPVTVDGYFFPKSPLEIYAAGEQAHVPLLVGWNSEENGFKSILGADEPTVTNYTKALQNRYGDRAPGLLKAYPVFSEADVVPMATRLASDQFIAYGTWKWSDLQSKTGGKPVYRYFYSRPRPVTKIAMAKMLLDSSLKAPFAAAAKAVANHGAGHSIEIEYALGNLPTNLVYEWQSDDYLVSSVMQGYFSNFIKTGNPNGTGLPAWPALQKQAPVSVLYIDVDTHAAAEKGRDGYLLMDAWGKK